MLVKDIVDTHKVTLIGTHSGLGGFFHGPLWLYLLIPFYLIGKGNPFVFTYAYILIALVTVLSGFLVGKKLYNTWTGLFIAFLLAVSPTIWSYVPNTIGVNMLPLVYIFLFYFLIRYLRGDIKAYIFAIFFAGLALQFEAALPLVVLLVVFLSFFLQKKAYKQWKIIFTSIGALLLSLSTFILFDIRHQFLQTKALLGIFSQSKQGSDYLTLPERFVSHAASFGNVYQSVLIQKTTILELLFLALIGLFLWYSKAKGNLPKQQLKEIWYVFLFPVALFIIYTGFAHPIYPEYLLGITVPVAIGLSVISTTVWKEIYGKVLVILFVSITLWIAGTKIFTPYHPDKTAGSYLNQKYVVDWILHDTHGEKVGYFVYTPETFTYGMDYLLWWKSKQLHTMQPVSEKLPVTYLILYPAPTGDEGAHAFWKKTKVRTNASVIERKQFPSGITVEKVSIKPDEPPVDPTYFQNLIFR